MAKVFDVEIFFSSSLFCCSHFFLLLFWVKNLFAQKDSTKKFAHREHVHGPENRFLSFSTQNRERNIWRIRLDLLDMVEAHVKIF